MLRKTITGPVFVPVLLCLQLIPLVLFSKSSYSLETQEWWLPALLSLLTIIALVQILLRRTIAVWPWYLLSFAQGFNIISRMMMLLPHAAKGAEGSIVFNTDYVLIAVAMMLLSGFAIWYMELPELRQRLAPKAEPKATA
jgi:hypothetical protein